MSNVQCRIMKDDPTSTLDIGHSTLDIQKGRNRGLFCIPPGIYSEENYKLFKKVRMSFRLFFSGAIE
jgi:hypothetical protein